MARVRSSQRASATAMSVSFFISVSTAVAMGHIGLINRGRVLCKSSR